MHSARPVSEKSYLQAGHSGRCALLSQLNSSMHVRAVHSGSSMSDSSMSGPRSAVCSARRYGGAQQQQQQRSNETGDDGFRHLTAVRQTVRQVSLRACAALSGIPFPMRALSFNAWVHATACMRA